MAKIRIPRKKKRALKGVIFNVTVFEFLELISNCFLSAKIKITNGRVFINTGDGIPWEYVNSSPYEPKTQQSSLRTHNPQTQQD